MALDGIYINELDAFTGNPSSETFLPIETASATYKIDAKSLVGVLELSVSSVSSLPQTISNTKITATMKVVHSVLSNPSAQTGDWTVTTSSGSAVVSGSISGTTDITLYLTEPK